MEERTAAVLVAAVEAVGSIAVVDSCRAVLVEVKIVLGEEEGRIVAVAGLVRRETFDLLEL